jgi:sugar lactone lactonase YvrE
MRRLPRLAAVVTTVALLLVGLVTATSAGAAPTHSDGTFPTRIDLPDGFAPEGITTGRGTTVYVGSLADGAIWQADVRTGEGSILAPGVEGRVAVGVEYDTARQVLWVAGGPTGTIRAYDTRTGDLLATYTFDAGFLNDLVVASDAVYATDSMMQQLAVVPLNGKELPDPQAATTLPLTGDLEYIEGFNANGIVAERGFLLVVQSNTGLLFRVEPSTGQTVQVDLGGYPLTNGDGLELRGSRLFVVRNMDNLIAEIRLGRHLTTGTLARELTSPDFDVPTTATFAAGRLWAVNARFSTPPTPTTAYWITQVPRR